MRVKVDVPGSPSLIVRNYGLCGRKATLKKKKKKKKKTKKKKKNVQRKKFSKRTICCGLKLRTIFVPRRRVSNN